MIAFQALCHVLKSYLPHICGETRNNVSSNMNNTSPSEHLQKFRYKSILDGDIAQYPTLLASLLDGLTIMTERFKLKWQECVETICVLYLAQGILNHSGILPMVRSLSPKLY